MTEAPTLNIRLVVPDKIIDLRHRILRAGLPIESARFEGDTNLYSFHYAAFPIHEGEFGIVPIGCASFMLNMYERVPAWQLRGMAVEVGYQGQGIGKQLLEKAQKDLTDDPEFARVEMMWCNARWSAIPFYEKNGWKRRSDMFDIPGAGAHVIMTKDI